MRRWLWNDLSKVTFALLACYLLAGALAPQLATWGRLFGETISPATAPSLFSALAEKAREAEFTDYYRRAFFVLLFISIPLVLPFLGNRSTPRRARQPWSFALPGHTIRPRRMGQKLEASAGYYWEVLSGFILAGTILAVVGWVTILLGYSYWQWDDEATRSLTPDFALSVGIALTSELVFRGIILGLCMRIMPPFPAIATSALFYAVTHTLQPVGSVPIPEAANLAFGISYFGEMLRSAFLTWQLWHVFVPCLAGGLLLGACRYRTTSLWLPIGLHAGWLFALRIFANGANPTQLQEQSSPFFLGANLSEGLFALGGIGLVALAVWSIYHEPDSRVEGVRKRPAGFNTDLDLGENRTG